MSSRSLLELGDLVQARARSIHELLTEANLPQPSLDHGSPAETTYPKAIREQRVELCEALDELRALVLGPNSYLYYTSILSPTWLATFNVLYHYRIAFHVPSQGSVPFSELAARCGLSEVDLRRIMRSAISLRVFEEHPSGHVRHNAVSAALATSTPHDAVGFFAQEFTPAALALPETLAKFPGSERAEESAIAIANGSTGDRDIFSTIASDSKRVERFGNAMSFNTTIPETSVDDLLEYAPWSPAHEQPSPWQTPKVLVDVGGSQGKLCEAFLRRFPDIETAVVEDRDEVTEQNLQSSPGEDVAQRIKYQAYDFFTPQPIHDADVYVFRTVLHDWPDPYAIRILQNQVPALKPGARLLIHDICVGAHSKRNVWIDQAQCAHDLFVKMGLNAKERTRDDWESLLARADPRYALESVITPPHSALSILCVLWRE